MAYLICSVIALVVGGVVAWVMAIYRYKSDFSDKLADSERRANTAEGTIYELRSQTQKADEAFQKASVELKAERGARVKAETQMQETLQRLDEQKNFLEESTKALMDTFKALASDTLADSNQSFLKLARETFGRVLADAKGDLGKRQEAIDGLVKPFAASLKGFEQHVRDLEKNRQQAYTSLEQQLKTLSATEQQLQKETGNLVTALRRPEIRGRWGEMTLKRVCELAGMSEHCDFTEQVTVESEGGRNRPDMIVHLPASREIVVDVKVPLDAYLSAISAETEEQRDTFMAQHTKQLRAHMTSLAAKAYWDQFDDTPEFVVMFIPGESFFVAAVDQDHAVIEDGMKNRVVLATPTTLIALLRAVAYGWRQEQIAKNAQEISNLGKQLYERMKVLAGYITEIGKGLEKANSSYNKAVRSMESRVFVAARRFKKLGAVSRDDIALVEPTETTPPELRALESEEGEES